MPGETALASPSLVGGHLPPTSGGAKDHSIDPNNWDRIHHIATMTPKGCVFHRSGVDNPAMLKALYRTRLQKIYVSNIIYCMRIVTT